jgi:glycosyltransferase involved in cell wall biosynthesis
LANPLVSIIIPHKDDRQGLARTLDSIAALSPLSPAHETIVVDNGSRCGPAALRAIIDQHGSDTTQLVVTPDGVPPGAGYPRNMGADIARSPILAFLDCDCLLSPDWLTVIAERIDHCPVMGGPVVVSLASGMTAPPNAAVAMDLLFGFDVPRMHRETGHVLSANLVVTRNLFLRIGPFPLVGAEDASWCDMAIRLGYRPCLEPRLCVQHVALDCPVRLEVRWRRFMLYRRIHWIESDRSDLAWLVYLMRIAFSPLIHGIRVFRHPQMKGSSTRLRLRTWGLLCRIRLGRSWQGLRLLLHR